MQIPGFFTLFLLQNISQYTISCRIDLIIRYNIEWMKRLTLKVASFCASRSLSDTCRSPWLAKDRLSGEYDTINMGQST